MVGHLFGHVNRLFEFCAGPGFIGFSLLASGLCDHLVLSDVKPRAVEAMRETVRINGLEEKVTVYRSNGLEDIPAHEQWDLVVSNPPHFPVQLFEHPSLITDDPDWRLHREFYRRVGDFLSPGGSLLLQENAEGSTPEDFLALIPEGGLSHIRTLWYSGGLSGAPFYFLWIKKELEGLAFDEDPQLMTVPLGDRGDAVLTAAAGRPCSMRLVNETGRPVRPQLLNDSGTSQLWLPLDEMAAGAIAQLPLVALRAGSFEIHDEAKDVTLARLVIR